jgi:hypothetical protein
MWLGLGLGARVATRAFSESRLRVARLPAGLEEERAVKPRILTGNTLARCAVAFGLALAAHSSAFAEADEPEAEEPVAEEIAEEPLEDDKDYAEPGGWMTIGAESPTTCPVNVGMRIVVQMSTHRHGNGPLEGFGALSGPVDRFRADLAASEVEVQLQAACATAPNENVEFIETPWARLELPPLGQEISCPEEKPVLMAMRCQTRTKLGWNSETN